MDALVPCPQSRIRCYQYVFACIYVFTFCIFAFFIFAFWSFAGCFHISTLKYNIQIVNFQLTNGRTLTLPELIKMRSQLVAQFMPFFRLIARILTLRDKKYSILMFRDKKCRILTFRDKTELYSTVFKTC